jgi:integrase
VPALIASTYTSEDSHGLRSSTSAAPPKSATESTPGPAAKPPVGVVARRQLGAELEAAFRAILYPPPWYETPLRFLEWLHNRILTRAGLPTATRFHDLRHTCATLLLTKGVHPKIVQEMLGHSSITITLDSYSQVLPNMQERAVSAMEDIFEGS